MTERNFKNGHSVPIKGDNGVFYKSMRELCKDLHVHRRTVKQEVLRNGCFVKNGVKYSIQIDNYLESGQQNDIIDEDYKRFLEMKNEAPTLFEKISFASKRKSGLGRYAVALFSDAHIEETVVPESVLGKNEYNIKIARERIESYFVNLSNALNEDGAESLIFASLGDTISGFIHEELSQCNGLTPIEATLLAQNLIYSGLSYLCEHTKLKKILFIGIVGNHSRTTKKIQHANGFKMSYEWMMYQNIKQQCEVSKLPIEFNIPEAELAVVDTDDGRRFIFCHGFQIKGGGNGTVCGIYPALNRLAMKWNRTFSQDRIFLGHFHSCTSITNAVVNGSIIGFNSFALTNGFAYEEPLQMYVLYEPEIGEVLTRKIACL